jgi:hypothetical protein
MASFGGFCEIAQAGISPEGRGQVNLKAVDNTFGWTTFVSRDGIGRELLATALTALANNKGVYAEIDDTAVWSTVSRMLLMC